MLHFAGFEDTLHVCSRIIGRPAGLDGISEYGTGPLQDSGCYIQRAEEFDSPDHLQDYRRGGLLNRKATKGREGIYPQGGHYLVTVRFRPANAVCLSPIQSNRPESILTLLPLGVLLRLSCGVWVYALHQMITSLVALLPGLLQADTFAITANGEKIVLPP
jgi:hypothetical protein